MSVLIDCFFVVNLKFTVMYLGCISISTPAQWVICYHFTLVEVLEYASVPCPLLNFREASTRMYYFAHHLHLGIKRCASECRRGNITVTL
jgi:hypothetical protein